MGFRENLRETARRAGGANETRSNRQNIAGRLADTLQKNNIQIKEIGHLKSIHIELYMKSREEDGVSLRTRQNEMSAIRQMLREADRHAIADSERISNKALGLSGASRDGTKIAMPDQFYVALIEKLDSHDKDIGACARLERYLGLRSEEAIQSWQSLKDWEKQLEKGDKIHVIYGTKGGRDRDVRIVDPEKAKEAVKFALNRIQENGGYLVNKPGLQEATERHSYVMRSNGAVGELSAHSLRYAFACDSIERYEAQGFSHKDALAMTSMDLGHGDGRGRYIQQVYSRR